MRDVAEFLSTPFLINQEKKIDLCTLLPDLNMWEQFSFALLAEAREQGWSAEETELFYRRSCADVISEDLCARMLAVFDAPDSQTYAAMEKCYGNRFSLLDGSYWATVLALGLDAQELDRAMEYLRLFTVALMEIAYMENRNPPTTYTWGYYESFRGMLDALVAEPEPDPLPLKVRAMGGTAGKRKGDAYLLSLGVDLENPNPDRAAQNVDLDITLKDKNGSVIATVKDRISEIAPATVFHYGVTRRIAGAATAGLSAKVRAASFQKSDATNRVTLSDARIGYGEAQTRLSGRITPPTKSPWSALALHYQFLSADNKILGGSNEWFYKTSESTDTLTLSASVPVEIKGAAKLVFSADPDKNE